MLPHLSPYYLTILIFTNNAPKPPGGNTVSTNTLNSLTKSCVLTQFKGAEVVLMWIPLWENKWSYLCTKVKKNMKILNDRLGKHCAAAWSHVPCERWVAG